MNGKERIEAVMRGVLPDRVPVMCQLSLGHVIKNSGVSPSDFYIDYNNVCVDTNISLAAEYGFDGFIMEKPGVDPKYLRSRVDHIADKSDGQLITWKNGDKTFCPLNDYPIEIPKTAPEKKDLFDITSDELMHNDAYLKDFDDLPDHYMDPYIKALELAGDVMSIHGYFVSPLSLFIYKFGIEDTLIGLLEYPERCKQLLFEISEGCRKWSDALIKCNIPVIGVSAPFEGGGFMSPAMYREFGLPYVTRVVKYVRDKGIFTYMHMCGAINDRLEILLESGVDGIECLDPEPIGNVKLEDAIKRLGGRVFIKGNIDPVNTLYMKTNDEVYADAVKRVKTGHSSGRFILSSACAVSPDTPKENLKVLLKAALEYGMY